MSQLVRRFIPLLLGGVIGFTIILSYFFSLPKTIADVSVTLINWGSIITAVSIGLGVIFLLRTNIRKISRKESGEWIYSLVVVISVFIFPILSILLGDTHPIYKTFYNMIINNIGQGVWGILLFSITGAVYKAFRVKSFNSNLLLITSLIVMFQIAPIGEVIWSGFPVIGKWIMDVPNTGAYRGMMMAAAFGLIALGFRTLLGYERGYLGAEEG